MTLQEAQQWEALGEYEKAADAYKAFIGGRAELDAQIYYRAGSCFFRLCEQAFTEDRYIQAVLFFVQAYQNSYKQKEALYQVLYTVVCEPNLEVLKRRYQERIAALHSGKTRWPLFEELPCLLFCMGAHRFVLYDREKQNFILEDVAKNQFLPYLYILLAEDFSAGLFEQFYHNLAAEQEAMALSQMIADQLAEKPKDSFALSKRIKRFHELAPFSERYAYFKARECLLQRREQEALRYIREGLKKRPLHIALHKLAAQAYFHQSRYEKAAEHYLFSVLKGEIKTWFDPEPYDFSAEVMEYLTTCWNLARQQSEQAGRDALRSMNRALTHAREFLARQEFAVDSQTGKLKIGKVFLLGKVIEQAAPDMRYCCGVYAEYSRINTCAGQVETLAANNLVLAYRTTYDILDAQIVTHFSHLEQGEYLLPLMALAYNAPLKIAYKGKQYEENFDKLKCNFLRVNAPVKLKSQRPFAMAKPIALRHDKKRRKLVLSILLDALSFHKIKQNDFALTPNVKRFFEKGIIFARNYTPAEWTYSSVASIQTGMYQGKNQLIHPDAYVYLDDEHQTITQKMRANGYYCMLMQGCFCNKLSNAYRGFHRVIGDESFSAARLIGVAKQNMEALRETDVYMHLHLLDAHIHGEPIAMEQQTNLDLADYLNLSMSDTKSVWDSAAGANVLHYEERVKMLDRVLGDLFHYLENTYEEDDYVITLHSDHGISIVGEEPFLFKRGLANSALMARGGGVPQRGVVDFEVTNTMDLYAILGKSCGYEPAAQTDCRLPKAFGGSGREYSVSNSLYPGQTFKMCIRSLQHTFYLETKREVSFDGKVNMNDFRYELFDADELQRVYDFDTAAHFIDIAMRHTASIHDGTV